MISTKRTRLELAVFFAYFFALAALAATALAELVQGTSDEGSNVPKPVVIGGRDSSGHTKAVAVTSNRAFQFEGVATEDSSTATGQPFLIAGKDSSGNVRVPNVTPIGNAVNGTARVLVEGAKDTSGNAQAIQSDTSGRQIMVGAVAAGAAVAGNPVLIGGRDGAGNAQIAAIETSTNALHVTSGLNFVLEATTPSGKKTSNGTTAVTIVSGSAGKRVLVGKLFVVNTNTTTIHTVDLIDSNAPSVVLAELIVPPNGTAIVDDNGAIQTTGLGALQFKIDSGGSGTDVIVTALTVSK